MGLKQTIHEDEQLGSIPVSLAHKAAPFPSFFQAARLRGLVTQVPVTVETSGIPHSMTPPTLSGLPKDKRGGTSSRG